MPRLRFDFWHVESPDRPARAIMEHAMATCQGLPPDHDDRLLRRSEKVIRLHRIEQRGALWFGDFVGIGVKRPATKAHVRGAMETLQMLPDEGLAEESAFLYDPSTNVFVLQSNRLAATPAAVIQFFTERTVGLGRIDMNPVLNARGMEEFSRFQQVSSFKVGIAKVSGGAVFRQRHSAARLTSIAEELEAPTVKLEVTVGHQWRRRSLSVDNLARMVRDLFAGSGAAYEVTSVEVTGRTRRRGI